MARERDSVKKLMEQGVYLQLKYLSCGERYYCEWERCRREVEEKEDKKESEYVCMSKKRDKMLE
jgi:hypothetical protein